jgi:hypothetical protein
MASSMTQSNHVYILIRLKITENTSGLSGCLFCHYGETDDVFLIGGAVEPNETLMAVAIRHCRRLVNFRLKPNQRLYLTKVVNGFIDHEPVKISIFVIDILFNHLR